jgi:vacuolar protein sorting-associated protein 53
MLLDVYNLKQGLLELPVLNTDPPVQPPALYNSSVQWNADLRYNKFVSKTIAKIETILKVILTAKEPPDGLVQNYFFLIADKSVTNFLKILELKVYLLRFRHSNSRVSENKNRTCI